MSTTIEFTAKPEGTFYTIAQINAAFAAIALVLNDKIDVSEPDIETALNVGLQAVINVAASTDDSDAATYAELLEWAPTEDA